MGKEGDLWDDSALINALDDAISKYKKMHSRGGRGGSEGETISTIGETISTINENVSAICEERSDDERKMQENNNDAASAKENYSIDTHTPEHYITSSNGPHLQNANSNSNTQHEHYMTSSSGQHLLNAQSITQGEEEYNRLLTQYYELEEQRQNILQQLYQFTGSNHQDSYVDQAPAAEVVPWGTTTLASNENHLQAAACPAAGSCCVYDCPCFAGRCTSLPAHCVGMCEIKNGEGMSVHCQNGKSIDGDLINTALGAAERALSSLKINDSGASDVDKGNVREGSEAKSGQENSSGTDLSVVLNAWYSAGFYTGKYVSEQSLAKK